ncbi:hypothetical protein FM101_10940 [Arthrobacter rhombi]|uniref:Uncharacterized protein n=1 Tax=Arthrobacter rhombi TaxID=71253 RepID=A0A1R4GJF1_9MICC|nr:hypothetical protein FM101_10940 [Arthrobacter rhombi]
MDWASIGGALIHNRHLLGGHYGPLSFHWKHEKQRTPDGSQRPKHRVPALLA